MSKVSLTARRLIASALIVEDVRRLSDAVGHLQDQSVALSPSQKSQDMEGGVPRELAPASMATEADRLSTAGVGIRWPLDSAEILKALNSYLTEPEGQLLLEVGGDAIAPSPPRKRCEECGEVAEPVKCGNCGDSQFLCMEHTNTATEDDGAETEVCQECAEDFETCYKCDGLIFAEAEIDIGGDNYCATCAEESSNCGECGDREFDEEMTYIESMDKHVCDSCKEGYGYCDGCNEYHHHDDMHYGDSSLCDNCWSETMTTCCECGEEIQTEDANYDEEEAEYYCDDCWSGGNLHEDTEDLGVEFDREVEGGETPLGERLGMLLRLLGEKDRAPIAGLKKSHPSLMAAIMSEYDINRLSEGNSITREKVETVRNGLGEKYKGLRVSVGEWAGDQRLYRGKNNLVFRLDVRDVIDEMESREDSAGEGSHLSAAVSLLETAAGAGVRDHPVIPKSTIGWARVVPLGDTWYIEELQSDFDSSAGAIKKYVKDKGKTVTLPGGVSAEDVRLGWPIVSDLLDNWEQYLLAKLADIARENGVKTLAIISKSQLDEWRETPPSKLYDVSGKTRSNTKRKRYYRDAPKSMGFSLKDEEIGGLKQKVWLRAASRDGLFERMARLVMFEASLGLPG